MDPDQYREKTKPLAKRLGWWWREQPPRFLLRALGTKDAEFAQQIFGAHFEESAWRYEVERRLGRIEGAAFSKLSLEEMETVVKNYPPADLGPEVMEVSGSTVQALTPPLGWTQFYVASFNLNHSTEALTNQVARFIEEERKKHGKARKPRSNEGRRNRPVSWNYVENFDLWKYREDHPRALLRVDIDHSMLSKFRRM